MALDLTQKTESKKPSTCATIILGAELPKNLKENWAAQDDQKYQEMARAWLREKDPKLKEQRGKELDKYWAKRRVELGFTEPEE